VSAIRAALDATMVRELQKLNSQMVLLTIAISGGPFLGLLGTVVGVMITFAAIAATAMSTSTPLHRVSPRRWWQPSPSGRRHPGAVRVQLPRQPYQKSQRRHAGVRR